MCRRKNLILFSCCTSIALITLFANSVNAQNLDPLNSAPAPSGNFAPGGLDLDMKLDDLTKQNAVIPEFEYRSQHGGTPERVRLAVRLTPCSLSPMK